MEETFLRITPLGGLGEIGMNCQLWDDGKTAVLIDCGQMFPGDLQMGIDTVIPPMDAVTAAKDRLKGLILTHGHEDHIGAVPWLAAFVDHLDIYGFPLTLELVRRKTDEHGVADRFTLIPVAANGIIRLGSMELTLIPVAHSIPQSCAIAARTPVGTIVHTGDFRFEAHPSDGVGTDEAALRRFAGKAGVRLLMCDSTNAESAGSALSEEAVEREFESIFADTAGRIIITTFSSHLDRIRMIYRLARRTGRSVIVSGRSLIANIETAKNVLGMDFPDELLTDQCMPDIPPERTVVLATGSQGEQLSALMRIIRGEHRQLGIVPGDTIILSARVIPGNARAVNRMINRLNRMGATVHHPDVRTVHVSGHGKRDDLKRMLGLLRPRFFIPVHGEYRHLMANRTLAIECGVAPSHALLIEDGQPVTLLPDAVRVEASSPSEPLLIDGKGVGDISDIVLHERRLLAENGTMIVAMVRDGLTGTLKFGPAIRTKGLLYEDTSGDLLETARRLAVDIAAAETDADTEKLHDRIRSSLRSLCRKELGRDPVVLPIIMDV